MDLSRELQEVMVFEEDEKPAAGGLKALTVEREVEEAASDEEPASSRKVRLLLSNGSISLLFIIIQALLAALAVLFHKIALFNIRDHWIFLPLGSGMLLHALQALKELNRGGLKLALDDGLIMVSVVFYSIPFIRILFGGPGPYEHSMAALLVPSGIFVLVWTGRAIEELTDGRLVEGTELTTVYDDKAVRRFMRERIRSRSAIARYSSLGANLMLALSPLSAVLILLWFLLVRGSPILDEKMWIFAAVVSIALCPRLFRNNIVASFFTGLLNGKRRGVRYSAESDFEKASVVDAVVFRKRGGVADERTRVLDMIRVGPIMEESLLSLCLSCEEGIRESEIAAAIVKYASGKNVAPADIRLRRHYPSKGVHCTSPYGEIIIGSRSFLIENGISLGMVEETARERERRGESVVFLAVDRRTQALFVLSNDIRPTAAPVCERLRGAGIVPAMISGDSMRTLEAIADRIGVEQVRSEIPLTGWAAELERIRDTGHRLAIVGRPPYKDKTSLMEDLVIEVREVHEEGEGPGFETGIVCRDENLELVVDAIQIAGKSRKVILVATAAALLVQVFAAGIALSGLVSPVGMGGFINVAAGALWLIHPRQAEKEV